MKEVLKITLEKLPKFSLKKQNRRKLCCLAANSVLVIEKRKKQIPDCSNVDSVGSKILNHSVSIFPMTNPTDFVPIYK